MQDILNRQSTIFTLEMTIHYEVKLLEMEIY